MLISAAETPLPEAADLAGRLGWDLQRIAGRDQLKQVLSEFEPVALAWDLEHARPGDWAIVQQLHTHPQWCCIPFMLFRKEATGDAPRSAAADAAGAASMTNILVKPLQAKTLADLIQSLQPTPAGGAILIVDDDPQARDAYQRLIAAQFAGFPVVTAEDGCCPSRSARGGQRWGCAAKAAAQELRVIELADWNTAFRLNPYQFGGGGAAGLMWSRALPPISGRCAQRRPESQAKERLVQVGANRSTVGTSMHRVRSGDDGHDASMSLRLVHLA